MPYRSAGDRPRRVQNGCNRVRDARILKSARRDLLHYLKGPVHQLIVSSVPARRGWLLPTRRGSQPGEFGAGVTVGSGASVDRGARLAPGIAVGDAVPAGSDPACEETVGDVLVGETLNRDGEGDLGIAAGDGLGGVDGDGDGGAEGTVTPGVSGRSGRTGRKWVTAATRVTAVRAAPASANSQRRRIGRAGCIVGGRAGCSWVAVTCIARADRAPRRRASRALIVGPPADRAGS
ncbi:hypothetical protein GCM10010435_74930 [Winogradskya consettensis]|uniref:Uncharacterized protein n=1 Tax=Winogradskya consettensis TaxID=113560 RepID=A0A919SZ79_9ACTN|nr:hypothetical protein Aco04nite_74710 [Actinoplanes consettensis]